MTAPTVAFVINVRNGERFVREAVASALTQTYPILRVHVVDDGSDDRTVDVVQEIDDPRVDIVRQPPRGVPFAKNAGLARVEADYVAYLDSDDVCKPDRIERQAAYLSANPEVLVVGSALELMDESGVYVGVRRYPATDAEIRKMLPLASPFAQSAILARTEAVRRAGGYDERYKSANDYSLWLRLSTMGRLANLHEALVRYRLHPNQRTQRVTKTILKEAIAVRMGVHRYGLQRTPKYWLSIAGQMVLVGVPTPLLVRMHRWLIKR